MHTEGTRRRRQNAELLACGIAPDEFDALLARLPVRSASGDITVRCERANIERRAVPAITVEAAR